jgi:sugar fermentation stimulation protein A
MMGYAAAPNGAGGLLWPELTPARLVRRYKRFLADVELESGATVTAHCPNSGAMTGCCEPGRRVYLSRHSDPRRKLAYTWEMIEMPGSLVGVNTLVPNRLVARALADGQVPALGGYADLKREVRVGEHSRIDLRLSATDRAPCYVEIKNCTLVSDGQALFPDAVTARGRRHLVELQQLVAQGCRCLMFFVIQRMDAGVFRPAEQIDPAYGAGLRRAVGSGVEILAWDVKIDLAAIRLNREIPCRL